MSWAKIGNTRRTWAVAGIGTLLILALGYGRYWKHAASTAPTVVSIEVPKAEVSRTAGAGNAPSLRGRPDPVLASRNYRRMGLAWILRQFGASDTQLTRMVDGHLRDEVAHLTESARTGNPTSVNILGWIAYQRCYLGQTNDIHDQYANSQITDARRLPTADAEWLAEAIRDDVAFDKQVNSVCEQIDVDQAMEWVAALAKKGDVASLFLLSRTADNVREMNQFLKDSAIGGFPQAEFELAVLPKDSLSGATVAGEDALNVGDLLRRSADQISTSEAALAECEYWGCEGVAIDTPSAIRRAREAAERGSVQAIIDIGPHLQASEIDPDEVSAWKVVDKDLQMDGCSSNGFNVRSMQRLAATPAPNPHAQALAETYWQRYGAQMMSGLGCAP